VGKADILLGLLIFVLGFFGNGYSQDSSTSNILEIPFSGYIQSCIGGYSLSVFENGEWRDLSDPFQGTKTSPCYLDGQFRPHGRCDVVNCMKYDGIRAIKLVEYKEVGKKDAPPYPGRESWPPVPMYETVPLRGYIKIEFPYFADSCCSNQHLYLDVIARE